MPVGPIIVAPATAPSTVIPSPLFLVTMLVIVVVIGTSFESTAPITIGLVLLILVGLILQGSSDIHALLTGEIKPQ
jgi:hypothetical protein